MEKYIIAATFTGAAAALIYAALTALRLRKYDEGTDLMKKISSSIRRGANAYLKRQYSVVGVFFAVMFIVLCLMAFVFKGDVGGHLLSPYVPFAFLTGGFFSGLAGFIGMKTATAANARTANRLPFGTQPRAEDRFQRRLGHGLYGSGFGTAGHIDMVRTAPVRL